MGLFGKKQDPDQRKLAERRSEGQAEIDRRFAYFQSRQVAPEPQHPSFTLIMGLTTDEKAE